MVEYATKNCKQQTVWGFGSICRQIAKKSNSITYVIYVLKKKTTVETAALEIYILINGSFQ